MKWKQHSRGASYGLLQMYRKIHKNINILLLFTLLVDYFPGSEFHNLKVICKYSESNMLLN